ncbi:nitroreductase family protein [bacterium]|nr:nitroreductase family protein [bacterium]
MSDAKKPDLENPVQDFVANRWSPVSFDGRSIERGELLSIFEAARWAPSAFNEQPWRYIVASREDGEPFEAILSCLVDANQTWARHAGAIALGVTALSFERNSKPNTYARHDLGLASGQLCAEAAARGVQVHQMAGILPDRARELYGIPENFEAVTALALGYPGENLELDEGIRARDGQARSRRPMAAILFGKSWDEPFGQN